MAASELHNELSQRALIWLEGKATQRGIRGGEEIGLGEGYVADAVAISGLTLTWEKRFLGGQRQVRVSGNGGHGIADDFIFIFESKVSRADFFNTFKHKNHIGDRLNPIGNFHFVVTPKGLLSPNEVPEFWGLLEQSGPGLGIKKMPEYIPVELSKLHETAYLLLRARHESRFGIWDELVDKFRKEQEIESEINHVAPHGT